MVECTETVPFVQAEEVHGPCIDVGEFQYEQGRCSCGYHIVPEGTFDGYVGVFADRVHLFGHVPDGQGVIALEYSGIDAVALVNHVFEHRGEGISAVIGIDLVACAEFAYIEGGVADGSKFLHFAAGHSQAGEKLVEYVTALDLGLFHEQSIGPEAQGPHGFIGIGLAFFAAAGTDCEYADCEYGDSFKHNAKIVIFKSSEKYLNLKICLLPSPYQFLHICFHPSWQFRPRVNLSAII